MLSLSTKSRYATRIIVYLAAREKPQPASAQEIARNEAISADYVEQILIRLKAAGIVKSQRGKKGGFNLSRDPYGLSVSDVLQAVEGNVPIVPCLEKRCRRAPICATRSVWQEASAALYRVLEEANIGRLAEDLRRLRADGVATYDI